MAVLLIGSTGNGKSTLGNFLFDPSSNAEELFEVARDNLPKTQSCKAITRDVKYRQGQRSSDTTSDGGTSQDTPDGTSQDTPEGTSHDTPNGTSSQDTPEDTSQDTPDGTSSQDTPEGTSQDTPDGTSSQDTPDGTSSHDTPEGTSQDTPDSTSSQDTPKGTSQDTPDGTSSQDTPDSASQDISSHNTSREDAHQRSGGAKFVENAISLLKSTYDKFSKAVGFKNEDKDMTKALTLIDTPGLNEGREKDFKHMTDLIDTLKRQQLFRVCIFVVKFSAKIDQQYKDTIKYYATLLPSLFSQNCLIVLTDYATDKRSEALRKKKGYDYDTIVKNITEEIIKSSGIRFTPIVFTIDSVPLEDEEVEQSKQVRDAMLSYIFSQRQVCMTEFRVAKTEILLSEDRKKINGYKGKIKGYSKRLKDMNPSAEDALDVLQSKEETITTIKADLIRQEESLKDKDSDDLVITHIWSIDDTWKFYNKQEKKFDETSEFEINNIKKWTNGHCQWKNFVQEGNRVHGVVEGKFMRGLYASITLETKKRNIHAEDIEKLKKAIESSKSEIQEVEHAVEDHRKKNSEFESEMSDLKRYIEDHREPIQSISHDTMTLEQARKLLETSK